jgi:hypothetical protein
LALSHITTAKKTWVLVILSMIYRGIIKSQWSASILEQKYKKKSIALLSKTNAYNHASICNITRTMVRVRFKYSGQASQMN